jgi:hypothetical protein
MLTPALMAPPTFTQVPELPTLTKPGPYAAHELAVGASFNGNTFANGAARSED